MLTLAAGASSLVVAPEQGGGLTGWMIGDTPILRHALPQTVIAGDPHDLACFPLLPYGNRLGLRRFHWFGSDYTVQRNFYDNPHTIHGIGWQRAWTVEHVTTQAVTLTLSHQPDPTWPFAFDARLAYTLSDAALTIDMQITNRHPTAAPAGLGMHPYFPKTNTPALRFNATGAWENGPDCLPLRHAPPPADWQHTQPRPIDQSRLDNCFTGWDGAATILAGPASLRIEATAIFRQLQVFTPSWADFFCVEPVSHVPDAINRPDLPLDQAMNLLVPHETLTGSIRFTLLGLAGDARYPNMPSIASAASRPVRISTSRT
jgi:aldose 1-epimerase